MILKIITISIVVGACILNSINQLEKATNTWSYNEFVLYIIWVIMYVLFNWLLIYYVII